MIDVGSGASRLIEGLLDAGFERLTALDLSAAALDAARARLGERAVRVRWVEADVTNASLPRSSFDLWHDRAAFHFLTEPTQRRAYAQLAAQSLHPRGRLIVATFADDGPERCSGLPVVRYAPEALAAELGDAFELVRSEREIHATPGGMEQRFVYCDLRRRA